MPPPAPPPEQPIIPIKATFFSGSEGPKRCRGHVIAAVDLPKPEGLGQGVVSLLGLLQVQDPLDLLVELVG